MFSSREKGAGMKLYKTSAISSELDTDFRCPIFSVDEDDRAQPTFMLVKVHMFLGMTVVSHYT